MTPAQTKALRALHQVAHLYGVHLSYYDIIARRRRRAAVDTLLAVLRALGAPLEELSDAEGALRERQRALWERLAEPVQVATRGNVRLEIRLPADAADSALHCRLQLEDGASREWGIELSQLRARQEQRVEGRRFVVKAFSLPHRLPDGYHRLELELASRPAEVLLIAPPAEGAYISADVPASRTWGVFLPLHALHSRRSWGCGDFTDLENLMNWVSRLGGGVVATLPFLAAFLDQPCEPSPYLPVSRLFWNELFLDISPVPELDDNPAAQALLSSPSLEQERDALEAAPRVDYRRVMALKRSLLEELAKGLLRHGGERLAAFEAYRKTHPILEDYARFRAVGERQRAGWPSWPLRLRDGGIQTGDYDEAARHFHLYVQWLAHQQLDAFARQAREKGPGLYLDLPLGVHPDGYDVWRRRQNFALGVSGGAPPDSFFTLGQDWGFPPLHPEKIRAEGYRYFISCLRHHLQYAGILRIDHLMGLHRLFWVPWGRKAIEGVYVRYPAREFYAILALESQRHQALIVGEDLGTVPGYVRPAMARHKIQRSYVAQFEIAAEPQPELRPVAPDSWASMNTHDMPTFAGYWDGLDLEDRVELGLLDAADAPAEKLQRERLKEALAVFLRRQGRLSASDSGPAAVLRACLAHLAGSPARIVTVNLEDLWGERQPQNVPGTTTQRPNWQRKAQLSFESFCQKPHILATLEEVDRSRKEEGETK